MSQECWPWCMEQVIPSERGAGHSIIDEVRQQLKEHNWHPHDIFSVSLALEEALVNAIKHGNGLDKDKRVRICCKMSPQRLWIEITDEGPGFNPQEVPDPTAPENLEKPSGRGIMLMRNYMTRVEYNASGNCVIMEKHRDCCS